MIAALLFGVVGLACAQQYMLDYSQDLALRTVLDDLGCNDTATKCPQPQNQQCPLPTIWQTIDIACNNFGSVVSIQLVSLGLAGTISTRIGRLNMLTKLILSGNALRSTLPSEFSQLSNLEELHLDSNLLEGSIGNIFDYFSRLRSLRLFSNKFTGSFPYLSNAPSLTEVNIASNEFSGNINPLVQPNANQNLRVLFAFENKFSSSIPNDISSFRNLEILHLGNNYLSGTIPPSIVYCSTLRVINLGANSLSGTIPSEMNRLSLLTGLQLSANNLVGFIPMLPLSLNKSNCAVQENVAAERNCLACAPTCGCAVRPCSPTPSPTPAPPTPKPTPRPMMALTLPTGATGDTPANPSNPTTDTTTITDSASSTFLATSGDDTFSDDTDVGEQGASSTFFTTTVIAAIAGGGGGLLLLIAVIVCVLVARRGKRDRKRDADADGAHAAINDVALAQSHYSSPPTLSTLSSDSIYTPARASHVYGAAPSEFVTVRDSTYHAPPAATPGELYHAPPVQGQLSYDAPPAVAQLQ